MNRREVLKASALFLGYAVSASAVSGLFASCAAGKGFGKKPEFLTKSQFKTISDMTEVILPRTATPGAKDLHIDRFIDKMLHDLLSPDEQQHFLKGLETFEALCTAQYGKKFGALAQAQQVEVLTKLDKEASKFPPSLWGISLAPPEPTHFFRTIKDLTLTGFYTSEQIGRNVLSFNPIPGVYIGCLPLSDVGNAWNEG